MLSYPGRFCGLLVTRSQINNCHMVQVVSGYGFRNYSKEKDSCCKDVPQTEGKRVEPWPKSDPPPTPWRCQCPYEPQPPNYDPYRIKVPDVVVPPLPPSNAKWPGVVLTTDQRGEHSGNPFQPGYQQQGYSPEQQQQQPMEQEPAKEEEEQGFLGFLKGLFGRGKKSRESDQMVGESDTLNEDFRMQYMYPQYQYGGSSGIPITDLFHNSSIAHPDNWKPKTETKIRGEERDRTSNEGFPRLGYHGRIKYKYAFHEPWKPLDRMSLLEKAEKDEMGQTEEELDLDKKSEKLIP